VVDRGFGTCRGQSWLHTMTNYYNIYNTVLSLILYARFATTNVKLSAGSDVKRSSNFEKKNEFNITIRQLTFVLRREL